MSYAIDSLAYDPYFMQAYQSYNPNFYGKQNYVQAGQPVQNSAAETLAGQVPPASSVPAAKEESSSGAALAIVGTVAAVGAAVLCRKAYKAGAGNGVMEKISDGLGKMFNSAKDKISGTASKVKKEFTYTTINGKEVCTIPNRTNRMHSSVAAQELEKIGASTEIPAITRTVDGKLALEEGVRLREYSFKIDGHDDIFRVKNGKLVEYKNASGENLLAKYTSPVEQADTDYKKLIDEAIGKYNKGQELEKLKNIKFTHTKDGVTRVFTKADKDTDAALQWAMSDRFALNSEAVGAYRYDNAEINKALTELAKNGKTNGLRLAQAEYDSTIEGGLTFLIKDGKIDGIRIGSQAYGTNSDKFKTLYLAHKDAFDNILKHKKHFKNKVYAKV